MNNGSEAVVVRYTNSYYPLEQRGSRAQSAAALLRRTSSCGPSVQKGPKVASEVNSQQLKAVTLLRSGSCPADLFAALQNQHLSFHGYRLGEITQAPLKDIPDADAFRLLKFSAPTLQRICILAGVDPIQDPVACVSQLTGRNMLALCRQKAEAKEARKRENGARRRGRKRKVAEESSTSSSTEHSPEKQKRTSSDRVDSTSCSTSTSTSTTSSKRSSPHDRWAKVHQGGPDEYEQRIYFVRSKFVPVASKWT